MRRLVGIIVLVSLFVVPTAAAQEGSSQHLPADLLYVGLGDVEGSDAQSPNALMRLDAETLTSSVFYYDSSLWLGIVPIAWSPNGSYLAVLQDQHSDDLLDLCLITRVGELHHCFERTVDLINYAERGRRKLRYWVTWLEDEQFIYFYYEENDTLRLVEADVASGKITRVLYELTTAPYSTTAFYWLQSLSYVVIAAYREHRIPDETGGRIRAITLFDVKVISPDANGDLNHETEISSLFDDNTTFYSGVSPDGTLLIALHYVDTGYPELWFLGATGKIVEAIPAGYFEAQNIWSVSQPTWQPESNAVYFWGFSQALDGSDQDVSLCRYVLGTEEPAKLIGNETFGFGNGLGMGSYLAVAPDASAVAFNYAIQSVPVELAIATADGAVLRFDGIKPVMPQLLWFPEDE